MLIVVQDVSQEGDEIVATVLDGAVPSVRRFNGEAAEAVSLAWVRSQRDRERYAASSPMFPAPNGIPVELP